MSDKFIQNSSNESNGAESQVAAEDTVQGNNAAQETQTRQGSNGSYNQYGNQNIGGPPYPQYQPYPPRPYSYEPIKGWSRMTYWGMFRQNRLLRSCSCARFSECCFRRYF